MGGRLAPRVASAEKTIATAPNTPATTKMRSTPMRGSSSARMSQATTVSGKCWPSHAGTRPHSQSARLVPTIIPMNPDVPSVPTTSATRTTGTRLEMNVLAEPKAPAMAIQKAIRSR